MVYTMCSMVYRSTCAWTSKMHKIMDSVITPSPLCFGILGYWAIVLGTLEVQVVPYP